MKYFKFKAFGRINMILVYVREVRSCCGETASRLYFDMCFDEEHTIGVWQCNHCKTAEQMPMYHESISTIKRC